MNKKQILKDLDYLENMITHFAHNPQDPEYGFFAFCSAPDLIYRIQQEMRPIHLRAVDWLKALAWRLSGGESEIPF